MSKRAAWVVLLGCWAALLLIAFAPVSKHQHRPVTRVEPELEAQLAQAFALRLSCLETGQEQALSDLYDRDSISGRWAYEHELGRVRYLKVWREARGLELGPVRASLSIIELNSAAERAWGSVCHHLAISYRGRGGGGLQEFGVRTIHWVELVRRDGQWRIQKDWFWDPFRGDSLNPQVAAAAARPPVRASGEEAAEGKYNRPRAVAYANRYAGVKMNGGDGRYNPRYRDFTSLGGDCANFASQVLADREAGGIPTGWNWFYSRGEGSQAWVQAGAFVFHLLDGGLAKLVKRGTYAEVAPFTGELRGGDIIAYQDKGEIAHVSVVVGASADGYLLVSSHSADRYRVPFDLGWDQATRYWLLRVVY